MQCESDAGGTVLGKGGPYAADVRIFGPGGPLFRRPPLYRRDHQTRDWPKWICGHTYIVASLLFSNSRLLAAFSLYHVSYSVVLELATFSYG